MSTQPDPESRKKQRFTLASLCVLLAVIGAVLLGRSELFDLDRTMMMGAVAVIILIPMTAMGVMVWRNRKDVDELQQRIQTDAAMITQNVTMVVITVLLLGETFLKDAFPMPDFSTLSIAYIWLVLGAGEYSKRRYQ